MIYKENQDNAAKKSVLKPFIFFSCHLVARITFHILVLVFSVIVRSNQLKNNLDLLVIIFTFLVINFRS